MMILSSEARKVNPYLAFAVGTGSSPISIATGSNAHTTVVIHSSVPQRGLPKARGGASSSRLSSSAFCTQFEWLVHLEYSLIPESAGRVQVRKVIRTKSDFQVL